MFFSKLEMRRAREPVGYRPTIDYVMPLRVREISPNIREPPLVILPGIALVTPFS